MKLRLIQLRDTLADSFWFLPLIMAVAAGIAALATVRLDDSVGGGWFEAFGWVWSGGPEGARSVLSVVAGSLMTVVSIVFSLTVTTLAQTSSHYGPRVLRNFTSDRFVQFTLGTFIATFVYCLGVLRTIRSVEESSFVPYLSVNLGVLLALISLAVLIFFIHHIALSIQAETLVADVGRDLLSAIPVLFPHRLGEPRDDGGTAPEPPDEEAWREAALVEADESGYLQAIDDDGLMALASEHDLLLKLEKRPGDFVVSEAALVRLLPPAALDEPLERRLRGCFTVGTRRTPYQDALYSLQQLVEIAAHALSPGINEPFTAFTCIDWLGAALRGVARRDLPESLRLDDAGRLRVVAPTLGFREIARAAFDQIRIYGASNPDVMLRLLRIIADSAPELRRESDRDILVEHARLIGEESSQIVNAADRRRVADALDETLRALARAKGERS